VEPNSTIQQKLQMVQLPQECTATQECLVKFKEKMDQAWDLPIESSIESLTHRNIKEALGVCTALEQKLDAHASVAAELKRIRANNVLELAGDLQPWTPPHAHAHLFDLPIGSLQWTRLREALRMTLEGILARAEAADLFSPIIEGTSSGAALPVTDREMIHSFVSGKGPLTFRWVLQVMFWPAQALHKINVVEKYGRVASAARSS
jgi:hypothetical protein